MKIPQTDEPSEQERQGRSKLKPSPKQHEVLKILSRFQKEHGYGPSLQELGEELGVSKVTVYQHVRALERKGLITRLRNKARSVQIVSDKHAGGGNSGSDGESLKVLGMIAAGNPIDVYEVADEIELSTFFSNRDRIYALKVKGNSMIDEHIREGDYVIVDPGRQANPGESVVARLSGGEVTLKKFYPEANRVRLQPANEELSPIYSKDVEILGIVVGVLRKYG